MRRASCSGQEQASHDSGYHQDFRSCGNAVPKCRPHRVVLRLDEVNAYLELSLLGLLERHLFVLGDVLTKPLK
jgi:hypothetical protein